MSQRRPPSRPGPSRTARQAEATARRRRRWGLGSAGSAVLVLGAVILGLHFAHRPAAPTGSSATSNAPAGIPAPGQSAPAGTFTTTSGRTVSVASLRGKPALLWFVATWCSSCQVGTQVMAQNVAKLRADGVRVEEVELYQDLGQSGPSIASFAKTLAGPAAADPAWTFGTSSAALTRAYDPQSYLDIYYLLNAKGQVSLVNSSPGSTMPQLLQAASRLT